MQQPPGQGGGKQPESIVEAEAREIRKRLEKLYFDNGRPPTRQEYMALENELYDYLHVRHPRIGRADLLHTIRRIITRHRDKIRDRWEEYVRERQAAENDIRRMNISDAEKARRRDAAEDKMLKDIARVPKEWITEKRGKEGRGRRRQFRRDVRTAGTDWITQHGFADIQDFRQRATAAQRRALKEHLRGERQRLRGDVLRETPKEAEERERGRAKRRRANRWRRSIPAYIEGKWGKDVMKVFTIIIFVALGLAISGAFGSMLFFFGFLSWALYSILPNPDEGTPPRELARQLKENPLTWRMVGSRAFLRNSHTGWGFLKTVFKLSTFILFIFGVWQSPLIPLKNIVLIVLCFGAYFSLKIKYNTHMPHHFIESVIRFGLLGAFFIPWVIFYGIFQSGLLAILAMAFFMIPPISDDKQNTETFAMYEMADKFIFFGLMVVALLASGVLPLPWFGDIGWKLTGTLQWTFLYFWVVSFVAGFFSPADQRPAMGFIMLTGATIIYGIGPGAQEFGTALLGPWYPVIQNIFSSIAKPFADVFGQFANTFGNALLLLTNPVGYAQSIMNGSYVRDSTTGLQGAYGLEIERFETMPIYTQSPYVVSVMLKNKGAFEAYNVTVMLFPSGNAPREEKSWVWGVKEAVLTVPKMAWETERRITESITGWDTSSIKINMPFMRPNITMTEDGLGFVEGPDTDRGITQKCIDDSICAFAMGNMSRLQTNQANFHSDGIMCPAVVRYALMTKEKAKVLPFIGMIQYDYAISSNLEVEAMTRVEWNRQVEEMELQPKFKKFTTFTNAPAMLNLDTLEQPILEGSPFHIALNLLSAQKKGKIVGNATVRVEIPTAFLEMEGVKPNCVPKRPDIIETKGNTTILTWNRLGEPHAIFCNFPPMKIPSGPTITYMVRANASYTFSKWDTLDTRIQFGGTACCKPEEAASKWCPIPNQICRADSTCGAGTGILHADPNYCAQKATLCINGEGGCTDSDQCDPVEQAIPDYGNVTCRVVEGIDNKICCQVDLPHSMCRQRFEDLTS